MTEKGNMAKLLEHLDGDGYAELLVVIQEQLCAQIDRWFAQYEAGDEHADGSSNVLAVEMAGTPEDPYIFVGQGLYVTELTRQGPYQAELAPEFMQDDSPAGYPMFEVKHLVKMLQRLEKESASWSFK